MYNLLLTGELNVGKTTLLKKIIERLDCSIGGFIVEIIINNNKKSFDFTSLYDGEIGNIFYNGGLNNNEYEVKEGVFNDKGVEILKKSYENRDVIIMDEIGFMEAKAERYKKELFKVLDSEKVVIGILRKRDCEFLNTIAKREDVSLININKENRDSILNGIFKILKNWHVPLKDCKNFYYDKKRINWYNSALSDKENTYPSIYIEEIKQYVGKLKGISVLDIGAGNGAFSIPLALQGAKITAVDSSFNMLYDLRARAKKLLINDIKTVLSPWDLAKVSDYDICICAYNGDTIMNEKSLEKIFNSINKYLFVIMPAFKMHRNFDINALYDKLNRRPKEYKYIAEDFINFLRKLGYKYNAKYIESKLHQRFTNKEEALEFCIKHFNIVDDKEKKITSEFIESKLYSENSKYILPSIRKTYLIMVEKPKV